MRRFTVAELARQLKAQGKMLLELRAEADARSRLDHANRISAVLAEDNRREIMLTDGVVRSAANGLTEDREALYGARVTATGPDTSQVGIANAIDLLRNEVQLLTKKLDTLHDDFLFRRRR